MVVTERRASANRRNSAHSTGPKDTSKTRANALVHGLCSSTVLAEDAEMLANRTREFFDTLRPQNDFHCWLVGEVALLTFQIDRGERMDRRARDRIAIQAETSWDDDRRLDAEILGGQLARRPAIVVDQLRQTPQGCEWLMERWAMLAYTYDIKASWTPEQKILAFDLLGTPEDFRVGHEPGVAIDFMGRPLDVGASASEVARREIAALMERREDVRGLDQANKALAMADLKDDHDAELKRLRKQMGSLNSRLRWCMNQLQKEAPPQEVPKWLKQKWLGFAMPWNPDNLPGDQYVPGPAKPVLNTPLVEHRTEQARIASPEPELAPEPEPEPVAQLTIVEGPEPAEVEVEAEATPLVPPVEPPMILTDRRAKAIKKAENRRASERRKLEKLRA